MIKINNKILLGNRLNKSIKNILKTGQNKTRTLNSKLKTTQNNHGITRDARYYSGKH
ncbi:hypothetical protein CLOSBL3_11696 [Clostridiaceae bacterium BL-3]|jgi:hypothetical protein|nr:hypothetical protein CLOSBL3_11696 [Clostridiaceae bacterium BL-3]